LRSIGASLTEAHAALAEYNSGKCREPQSPKGRHSTELRRPI